MGGRHFRFAATCFFAAVLVAAAGPLRRVEDPHWYPAASTWYGSPEGDGSDGGACGYGTMVDVKPFRARVGAVSPVLFKGGEGCGACYKVKCLDRSICSRRAVTVIITDECPGCANDRVHFDLSGAAFGRMAVTGYGGSLRNRGELPVIYRRFRLITAVESNNGCRQVVGGGVRRTLRTAEVVLWCTGSLASPSVSTAQEVKKSAFPAHLGQSIHSS